MGLQILNFWTQKSGEQKDNSKIKLNVDNNEITDRKIISDTFVNYFTKYPLIKINNYFGLQVSSTCTYLERNMDAIFFQPITPYEVSNIFKKLKMRHSWGLDGIHMQLLKYASEVIADSSYT